LQGVTAETLPPGPREPPALQTLRWVIRPTAFMEEQQRRYGDTFTVRLLNSPPMVFTSDPEALREVFTADPDVLQAGAANQILQPVMGANSVLLLDGERHLRQRRLMLPSFHGEKMQRHEATMAAVAAEEIARWPVGERFELLPRMQAVTLEVIVRAIFGVREGERLARLRALLRELTGWASARHVFMFAIFGPTPLGPRIAARLDAVLRPIHALLDEEIAERRADPRLGERDDVFSLLLGARDGAPPGSPEGEPVVDSPLSDAELRDELVTLLLAGHETSATALAWTVERLLRHPAVLRRVQEEAASDGTDAPYLDAVVKETLRLRPVVPIVARRLAAPFALRGRTLPAGVEIAPCIYLTHRRADVYPNPLAFRPERFLEQPAGTYTWIPFGGGVRRCLGASFALLEIKLVLRAIVRGTDLLPAAPQSERVRRRAITYAPRRGAAVVLARRLPA
jgi:cytochrome P450 family 135